MISSKLVLTLLTAISGYTGYAIPGDPPQITAMPHDQLAERVGRRHPIFPFDAPNAAKGRPVSTTVAIFR